MVTLAQLIKLHDYITRYEWDTYRYPSQYIRLKQDNWTKLYDRWLNPEQALEETEMEVETSSSRVSKLKSFWKKDVPNTDEEQKEQPKEELPGTEEELKHYFLDELFDFQIKWATSTVTERSIMNKKLLEDPLLKFFLQRFPDSYLLMYFPIFSIKKAPVDGEILLISPLGIEIIYMAEAEKGASFIAGEERTWTVKGEKDSRKLLNPLIALKRTEQIVRSILRTKSIDFPIQKTVLSRTNLIINHYKPYQTNIIDQRTFKEWFQAKRTLSAPLKSSQLKAADALLSHCQTTSVKRPEWEEEAITFTFADDDKN
ncbi:NERD domain-containing protein [Oceanobacillus kapialis]|uniref:NERD domain-containing protein n=1 Tax=Oceanobacillus kapialis TaxID=481353 RepID=A0ABW5Q4A5_9BACI